MDNKNLKEALEQVGETLREQMIEELFNNGTNASGDLARSLRFEVTDDLLLEGYAAEYADFIEDGRGGAKQGTRGKSQVYPQILQWIKDKNIKPRDPNITPQQLAFLITRKINKKGYSPQPFIAPAIKRTNERFIPQTLLDAGVKDLNDVIVGELKDKNFK